MINEKMLEKIVEDQNKSIMFLTDQVYLLKNMVIELSKNCPNENIQENLVAFLDCFNENEDNFIRRNKD